MGLSTALRGATLTLVVRVAGACWDDEAAHADDAEKPTSCALELQTNGTCCVASPLLAKNGPCVKCTKRNRSNLKQYVLWVQRKHQLNA